MGKLLLPPGEIIKNANAERNKQGEIVLKKSTNKPVYKKAPNINSIKMLSQTERKAIKELVVHNLG